MNKPDLTARLDAAGLKYAALDIGAGREIVVTERGGRVFGPFRAGMDGLFWTSDALGSDERFAEFLKSGAWNMGGDRIWIAPEIELSVGDRDRFWQTLKTPEDIDPGRYVLAPGPGRVELSAEITLSARNIGSGSITLRLARAVRASRNPLRSLAEYDGLMSGVEYCGYEQLLTISGSGSEDAVAEYWDLLQVVPPGRIYIPMYSPARGVNYYEPVGGRERLSERGAELEATGDARYKVGYKAARIAGRVAYATRSGGAPTLLVRSFPNDPSDIYAEEPPLLRGENGFSVHVYNDDGDSGGFTEIECNLRAVSGKPGCGEASDVVNTWIFTGAESSLDAIARALTGFERLEY